MKEIHNLLALVERNEERKISILLLEVFLGVTKLIQWNYMPSKYIFLGVILISKFFFSSLPSCLISIHLRSVQLWSATILRFIPSHAASTTALWGSSASNRPVYWQNSGEHNLNAANPGGRSTEICTAVVVYFGGLHNAGLEITDSINDTNLSCPLFFTTKYIKKQNENFWDSIF